MLRIFRKNISTVPDISVTAGMYRQWLRAQRPPFEWFVRLSESEQDYLARLGDEYVSQVAGDIAEGSQAAREEASVQALAAEATRTLLQKGRQSPIPTMGGLGARKNGAMGQKLTEAMTP